MAIIGSGGVVQKAHVRAFRGRQDVKVVAVADPIEANRAAVGKMLGCAVVEDDYRRVLDRTDVQAVDICVPHFLHERAVLDAFDAGKDVLLEKPIALTLEQADRMIAAARKASRKFYVALNQRFYPAHAKLKEALDSGQYGRPFLALAQLIGDEFERMNIQDNWKGTWDLAGGGALADTGTHIMDLILWWFGTPASVSCQWGRFVVEADNKADDNVVVTLQYPHMLAQVTVSYSVRSDVWREDKQVYCPDVSFHICMDPDLALRVGRNQQPPQPVPLPSMVPWWEESVAAGIGHFLDCLMDKAEPRYGPEAARATLALILLAYKAAAEGRSVPVTEAALYPA